ncbi:Protein-tyrosine phosphatase, partial [Ancylostoma duodenale]
LSFRQVRPLSEIDNFVRVCRLKLDYYENGRETSTVIRHFQWENWPDRGVPPTRLTATNILSEVRGTTRPIVVHCSAGIGRTGTIVAIAYVQEKMQHGQNCMDMDALTKELRTQRPYSIQNEYGKERQNMRNGEKNTKWPLAVIEIAFKAK